MHRKELGLERKTPMETTVIPTEKNVRDCIFKIEHICMIIAERLHFSSEKLNSCFGLHYLLSLHKILLQNKTVLRLLHSSN